VIYLFQFGGPSQIDLFDPKPGLKKLQGADLPPKSAWANASRNDCGTVNVPGRLLVVPLRVSTARAARG
jgi:hypothetical protein